MNNLEDIILEKYTEGVIDDEHFLSLYEAADEFDEFEDMDAALDELKKSVRRSHANNAIARGATLGTAAGASVAGVKVNNEVNKEVIEAFKAAKESYKKNIKEAKQHIKTDASANAKKNISAAIKDIEKCEKIVKDADVNALQWIAQSWGTTVKEFWSALTAGAIMGIIGKDAKFGTTMAASILAGLKLSKMVNMFKYNKNVDNLGKMLNGQRANMLAELNRCKKELKKLEDKIK